MSIAKFDESIHVSDQSQWTPATVQRETPSSVEISRNAKGDVQYGVKVYSAVGDEEAALERAMALYARLQATYGESKP